jgi:hypothetical protein
MPKDDLFVTRKRPRKSSGPTWKETAIREREEKCDAAIVAVKAWEDRFTNQLAKERAQSELMLHIARLNGNGQLRKELAQALDVESKSDKEADEA